MRFIPGVAAAFLIAGAVQSVPARAQFQNPIQAAKDAYKNAKQQSQPKGQAQPAQQQTQVASAAAPSAGAAQSQGPVSLDIIGIKPGESMNDAIQALKADNPKMRITPTSFQHAEFKDPITVEVDGQDLEDNNSPVITQATETVQLMFTTPPSQPAVWAISRYYLFPTAQRPSTQTTIDALRKKYGPETIPPDSPIGMQSMTWIFDPQGKLMAGGAQMDRTCGGTLPKYVANSGMGSQAEHLDIAGPSMPNWPQQCSSMIELRAQMQIEQVAPNQYAVKALTETLEDGGRYMNALAGTRAVIAAAAKAQQDKQTNQMNQAAPPKL